MSRDYDRVSKFYVMHMRARGVFTEALCGHTHGLRLFVTPTVAEVTCLRCLAILAKRVK